MITAWRTRVLAITSFLKDLQSYAEIVSDVTSYRFYLSNFLFLVQVAFLKVRYIMYQKFKI